MAPAFNGQSVFYGTSRDMSIKEEWKAKTDRLERARIKAEEFIAAGGDLKSKKAVPLGMELIKAP